MRSVKNSRHGLMDPDQDKNEGEDDQENKEDMSFSSKQSIEAMSAAQTEVLSVQMNKEQFETLDKIRTYLAFSCLILISISSLM